MTEAQRIVKSGLVSKDYLKPEVNCGFYVSEERKRLFAVLLEMLYKYDQVCKKYNLKYFLIYGSLLGAVRHKGFVPWDDDLDVCMPRADYEKFIQLSEEFTDPLFLQTPYTDKNYFYTPARIRNNNTTGVVELFKHAGFNQGVWFSIFPLDFWDDNGGEERYLKIRQLAMHNSTYMRLKNPNLSDKDKARVAAYLAEHRDPLQDYEEIHRLASSCKDPNSEHVMMAVITLEKYERKLLHAADFASSVDIDFEGLKIPAPSGYENVLHFLYGDYMQFPPMEQRGLKHAGTVFDTEIPYKDYLAREGIIF